MEGITNAIVKVILTIVFFFMSLFAPLIFGTYETNDIADYGIVKGNYDNNTPKAFVSAYFPEKVEDYFSDVTYHYKAKEGDTYAYEMYLEFVIEDNDRYTSFLSNVVGNEICEPFCFDSTYQAHYISNTLDIGTSADGHSFYILGAEIGLVLFSDAEQRFIFTALGVYDGGMAKMHDFSFFLNRFGIDPLEYIEQTNVRGGLIPTPQ